jgi:hypothetical protein
MVLQLMGAGISCRLITFLKHQGNGHYWKEFRLKFSTQFIYRLHIFNRYADRSIRAKFSHVGMLRLHI